MIMTFWFRSMWYMTCEEGHGSSYILAGDKACPTAEYTILAATLIKMAKKIFSSTHAITGCVRENFLIRSAKHCSQFFPESRISSTSSATILCSSSERTLDSSEMSVAVYSSANDDRRVSSAIRVSVNGSIRYVALDMIRDHS